VPPKIRVAVEQLEKLPRAVLAALALLLVCLVASARYHSGQELRLSFLFLLPISLASWFVGLRWGIAISILSALGWLVSSLTSGHTFSRDSIPYWNSLLLLGFFLIFGVLLSVLRRALDREKVTARTDWLTKIANRRAFLQLANLEISRAARYQRPFTVAYIDLDDFKQVNDRYGHEAGDQVLCLVAETLQKSIRANDIVARLGGDEFVVLLPETGGEAADIVVRKLRDDLGSVVRKGQWPATVSIGAITFEKPPLSVEEMMKMADGLMYSAKKGGKNLIEKGVVGPNTQ
jgi:diguanylate cyclase (GGDEF)-like protein